MNCPQCSRPTGVTDSRGIESGAIVRRRRKCGSCGFRFTSAEVPLAGDDHDYNTTRLMELSRLMTGMDQDDRDAVMFVARRFGNARLGT